MLNLNLTSQYRHQMTQHQPHPQQVQCSIIYIPGFTIFHVIYMTLLLPHIIHNTGASKVIIILICITFSTDMMKQCLSNDESLSVLKIFSVQKNLGKISSTFESVTDLVID